MKSIRNLLFWVHLAGGVASGLFILVMAVTGLLLVYQRQIMTWLETPVVLQSLTGESAHMPLDALLNQALRNGQGIPEQVVLRNNPNAAVEARFEHNRTLFLNPWTGEIVGLPSEGASSFFSTVTALHRSLGLRIGHGLVKTANLIFLFLLLSGLFLWFPNSFTSATLKNRLSFVRGLKGKARHWNWHHVIGLWSAIPLFFIVLTGVLISFPDIPRALFSMTASPASFEEQRHENSRRRDHSHHPRPPIASLPVNLQGFDAMVQTARLKFPQWQSISIQMPRPQDKTMTLAVDKSRGGQPEQVTQLVFDQNDLSIKEVRDFASLDAGHKFRILVRTIHTGEEFGLIGQTIAALSCLGAIFLVWTGFCLAWRRYQNSKKIPANGSA